MFIQQLFNVWQDLAAEATGHDTEWSYAISIDRLAQALHLTPKILVVLLANLAQPELEVGLNGTLTFHQPPTQSDIGGNHSGILSHSSLLTRLKPSENCLSQKRSLTLINDQSNN
jgi:hypothetical protein